MKTIPSLFSAALVLAICATGYPGLAPMNPPTNFIVTMNHANGCYAVGEQVVWTITLPVAASAPKSLPHYVIQADGLNAIASGSLMFVNGKAVVTSTLSRPGTLLLTITADPSTVLRSGAAVAWSRIKPAASEPADFDQFWHDKIRQLSTIPPEPALEEVDSGSPSVRLWKITLNCINGSKIRGYLARPVGDGPRPAMLQLQHAGTLSLKKHWVVGPAENGWIAMDILAHDLPVDREDAFYRQQLTGPLLDYIHIGADSRDGSYFLRMYLAGYRSVDYLAGRADWNKTTLVVQGDSQGGMQALAVAGLNPAVTCMTVCVPSGADQAGGLAGRAVAFPYWLGDATGPERAIRLKVCGYFDTINFAKRIRCPSLVGMGLCDVTVPADGIFAMFNQIRSPKRLVIMPTATHKTGHDDYEAIKRQWWTTTAAGKTLPVD